MKTLVLIGISVLLIACGGGGGGSDNDTDRDKVANSQDNCPKIGNVGQEDVDNDGIGDSCDMDWDNDGIQNAADNCPKIANDDQKNTDGDELGDLCDDDIDNDGVENDTDVFPLDKLEQKDFDGDKVGDNSDNCELWPNTNQADANKDGRGDACSIALNDTGVNYALDYESGVMDGCLSNANGNNTLAIQDCSLGRDAEIRAGKLSKVGVSDASSDFSKIASDGALLANQTLPWSNEGSEADNNQWSCVQDNITGLLWERKTSSGLRSINDQYSRFTKSDYTAQNVKVPDDIDDNECSHAKDQVESFSCFSENYIAELNKMKLCGRDDWRLPKGYEVADIKHYTNSANEDALSGDLFLSSHNIYSVMLHVDEYGFTKLDGRPNTMFSSQSMIGPGQYGDGPSIVTFARLMLVSGDK